MAKKLQSGVGGLIAPLIVLSVSGSVQQPPAPPVSESVDFDTEPALRSTRSRWVRPPCAAAAGSGDPPRGPRPYPAAPSLCVTPHPSSVAQALSIRDASLKSVVPSQAELEVLAAAVRI